jgi:hypothetical protein
MGPEGRGTLCNACGLRYRKKLKAERASDESMAIPKNPSHNSLSMLLNSSNASVPFDHDEHFDPDPDLEPLEPRRSSGGPSSDLPRL